MSTGRHICLAVLLGLLIGHASVALHTAAHWGQDVSHCDICISHGNLAQAFDSPPASDRLRAAPVRVAATVPAYTVRPAMIPRHQRGPPAPA